ncbi:MAG: hypothetical protein HFF02_07825 [Erysipelotrichaceae bacterium]|nr:hypothetical protein [Erysipelotrichaceae bacterium]
MSYKQNVLTYKLIRIIDTRLKKYPDNLGIIINDVIAEHSTLIMNVFHKQPNKDCYKRAVAINDCLYALGKEQLYLLTVSKQQLELLYNPKNVLYHKEQLFELQEELSFKENVIKEFIAFDKSLKDKISDKERQQEKMEKGTYEHKLKYLSLTVVLESDNSYSYRNINLNDNISKSKVKEKELIL